MSCSHLVYRVDAGYNIRKGRHGYIWTSLSHRTRPCLELVGVPYYSSRHPTSQCSQATAFFLPDDQLLPRGIAFHKLKRSFVASGLAYLCLRLVV